MTSETDDTNDMQPIESKAHSVDSPADDVAVPSPSESEPTSEVTAESAPLSESVPVQDAEKSNKPIPSPLLDFAHAGLSRAVLEAIQDAHWKTPRALDGLCLPLTLSGKDVVIHASAKTSAISFLTLAHRVQATTEAGDATEAPTPQAIVVFSTTHAADKSCQDFNRLFSNLSLVAATLVDPEEISSEFVQEKLTKADIIFASAGSLKTGFLKKHVAFDKVSLCICRDVEGLLDSGAKSDLEFVLGRLNDAQKVLFSSAVSKRVRELAQGYLTSPEYVSLERERATIPSVTHSAYLCETPTKFKVLLGLLRDHEPKSALVFANSKLSAAWLYHKLLENGYAAELIGGDAAPAVPAVTTDAEASKAKIFVATDFAARDFHFGELSHVYNFDLADNSESYLNRMGQVGKDGPGFVCSLVCDEYGENYQHVQDLLGQKAPKPVWPKEEYLQIVDKSGNPFLEKNIGYVPSRFDERPHRGGHDRHQDGDRRPFRGRGDRPEREERPHRGDRMDRERSERPDRSERSERFEPRGERISRIERVERHERTDRAARPQRAERGERHDHGDRTEIRKSAAPMSKGPQIRPRTPKKVHTPTQVRPIEQRRIVLKEANRSSGSGGLLKKFLSLFLPKKKK